MRGTGFGFGSWQQSRTEGSGAVSEDPFNLNVGSNGAITSITAA